MHFLGPNIYFLRKRRSINQKDLAQLVGKGQTTIGNWENGVSEPSIDELLVLSNFFAISLDDLVRDDLSLSPAKTATPLKPVTYEQDIIPSPQVEESDPIYTRDLQKEIHALWNEVESLRKILDEKENSKEKKPGKKNGQP